MLLNSFEYHRAHVLKRTLRALPLDGNAFFLIIFSKNADYFNESTELLERGPIQG